MSEKKRERGFEFVWIPASEVLNKMRDSHPMNTKAELVKMRDMIIFEEYLKTKKETRY
jgi:hypothetical protein